MIFFLDAILNNWDSLQCTQINVHNSILNKGSAKCDNCILNVTRKLKMCPDLFFSCQCACVCKLSHLFCISLVCACMQLFFSDVFKQKFACKLLLLVFETPCILLPSVYTSQMCGCYIFKCQWLSK